MGYLNHRHLSLGPNVNAELMVLSRRNRYRAGVRMHCRGIDDDGNVANYVETEQVNSQRCCLVNFLFRFYEQEIIFCRLL